MLGPARPDDNQLRELLSRCKTIAVVGLSPNPARASNRVAVYLQKAGFHIIPVNPALEEVLGEKCYPDLASIPGPVDIVDVFRRPEFVPAIARQAVEIGAKLLWLQESVVHDEAALAVSQAGMAVVQDACLKIDHARLLRD